MNQQTLYTIYALGARWKSSFGSDCTQIREFSWSGVYRGVAHLLFRNAGADL